MIDRANWTALLIGGSSGVGKATAARYVGHRHGVSVLQVDDLRLAFQHSRATLPDMADTQALYLFWDVPDVWRRSPEELRDGLIAVGRAMSPAIEVVVANPSSRREVACWKPCRVDAAPGALRRAV